MAKITYYLICGKTVGKREREDEPFHVRDYLFTDGQWLPDRRVISDRLIGYDSSEPYGSPYWCGNTSIMDEIEVISEEHARALIGE